MFMPIIEHYIHILLSLQDESSEDESSESKCESCMESESGEVEEKMEASTVQESKDDDSEVGLRYGFL